MINDYKKKFINSEYYIIHLANPTDKESVHGSNFLTISLEIMKKLCQLSHVIQPKKIINFSSGKVNWTINHNTTITENPLGNVKYECEKYLNKNVYIETGVENIRLYNAYGPNQRNDYLVPKIFDAIYKNKKLKLGTVNHKRDFIYIKDVINSLSYLIDSDQVHNVYELGTGVEVKVEDLINKIFEKTKKRFQFS